MAECLLVGVTYAPAECRQWWSERIATVAQQTITVFYSWQSDLSGSTNRNFIETALRAAADALRVDESIDVEPVIDRDTAGVPGSPDISSTIFEKIDHADIFVCDVSIVNRDVMEAIDAIRALDDKTMLPGIANDIVVRPTPNPNVLIELGYALKVLGLKRIVLVLNDAYGAPELLPFDLRLKRVARYTTSPGPAAAGERTADRRRLEALLTEALRVIIAGLDMPPGAEMVQPLSLAEQAILAIDEARPNQVAVVRRYMTWLAKEIGARMPQFNDEPDTDKWYDMLMGTINESVGLVAEFARVAQAVAAMDAAEVAHAVYKGFAGILELYNHRPGGLIHFHDEDFDFAKFMGHDLFVTFFSFLIHDERWELIADLLDDDLYVANAYGHEPDIVPFAYIARPVTVFDYRNTRLRPRKLSVHADVLNGRHTSGALAQLVPMIQFMEADYFLALRYRLITLQERAIVDWHPWSTLYMKHPPRFLVQASRDTQARRLMRPLGLEGEDIVALRSQLAAVMLWHEGLFTNGGWHSPMRHFDVRTVGSR